MLVPKRDAKHYGAVYVDNYMDYIGFCKKVESDDAQNVDVFIDGNKIDTILADKNIPKISQIYDIEGFGFSYELPEIYLDKPHTISFKASDSSEELLNSPIGIIHKNHPKFNEYKFLNSLSKPIDEDKIKDMYCPNSIGFLATEENLADEEFVGYIKELMVRFPEVEFKGFCFNEKQKKLLRRLNIENIVISNITQIAKKINLFIQTLKHDNLVPFLITQDIYNIWFINEAYNSNLTVDDYDSNKDPYNFKSFNYKDTEKISDNYAINFRNKMNSNSNTELLSKIIYFERVESFFSSKEVKNFLLKKF